MARRVDLLDPPDRLEQDRDLPSLALDLFPGALRAPDPSRSQMLQALPPEGRRPLLDEPDRQPIAPEAADGQSIDVPAQYSFLYASSRPARRAAGSDMRQDPRPVGGLFSH